VDDNIIKTYLPLNYSKYFVLSAWINPFYDDRTTGSRRAIYTINYTGLYTPYAHLGYRNISGVSNYYFRFVSNLTGCDDTASFDLNESLYNQWRNVVGVFNGSLVKLYIDGELVDTNSVTSGCVDELEHESETKLLKIGYHEDSVNGSIDDIFIYNSNLNWGAVNYIYYTSSRKDEIPIPVLMHHQICNSSIDGQCRNETQMREELQFFQDAGFTSITDYDYVQAKNNNFTLPDKPIIFIWDDGLNNTLIAADIMSDYGYKGVSAITTSYIGNYGRSYLGSSYLNWTEVNILIDTYNWSIASHSDYHCSFAANSSPISLMCNDTISMTGNFTVSKQEIIDNTGYTPVGFVFPYNNWDSDSMNNCSLYYDFCTADAQTLKYLADDLTEPFLTINSNMLNGDIDRIGISNNSLISEFNEFLNFSYNQSKVLIEYNLNENSGTTAYDVSGNNNDGTISGATWNDDGVDIALTDGTDYTIGLTTGIFTLLNANRDYEQIVASWIYLDINSGNNSTNSTITHLIEIFVALAMLAFILLIINYYRKQIE